jgi:predicted AlkP superfamily phosphohydrolase/phosphomutase
MMKALVIGLDGATFNVFTPLMQAGYLPNLRRAFSMGAVGELLSTIPPVTALAWPSFMTGKNPGKHGLFGWQERLNAKFERPWVSGKVVRGAKMWDLANQGGLRACVVNVPVTYPPEPLNGVMVTGLLTPGLKARFIYPSELKEEFLAANPDYQIDVDVQHTWRDAGDLDGIQRFLQEVLNATRARGKAMRWLLEREHPDLAVIVFELPDRLQHILWRYIECLPVPLEESPGSEVIQRGLLACYQALDEEVGRLVEKLPQAAYLALLSDHGFGPLDVLVYVNEWLAQQGWLAYNQRRVGGREILQQMGRRMREWLPNTLVRKARQAFPVLHTFDWSQTLAYGGLPSENGIFVNLHGREPAGIVETDDYDSIRSEIIAALCAWRDPHADQPIMKAVYRREELYHGPFVTQSPDIVFEFQRGYKVSHLPFQGKLLYSVTDRPSGFHERAGIFAMSGPGINPDMRVNRAEIQDVMPTLLYALGLPIPDDLDGRLLTEIFTPMWQLEHSPCSRRSTNAETIADLQTSHTYSVEEESLIAERLKGLGYLE